MLVYEILFLIPSYYSKKIMNESKLYQILSKKEKPTFDMKIPEIYKNLIQSCWDDDPKKRPTFAQIVNDLKTKPEFI